MKEGGGDGSNRFEKEYTAGPNKMRFKVIVQDGVVYLKCIDRFEDIFNLSRDIIKSLELTDILEPAMFDSHKDIIDALFDTYRDVSKAYLDVKYFSK